MKAIDERHALYAGWVAGLAMGNGLHVEPVHDERGRVTDHLRIRLRRNRGTTTTITVVVPPPPEDWHLGEERCSAKWLYRGRTRALCYGQPGHEGKHWNGTVQWTDSTPGAVPAGAKT